jgi:Tol biopolymer transport system component
MRACLKFGMILLALAGSGLAQTSQETMPKHRFMSEVRQLTFEGRRAGEGYFSADGSKMVFQSERDPKNPFYQIFLMDMQTGDVERISPGMGKTTCAWVHPDNNRVLYASTHLDPKSKQYQQDELDMRASGQQRRYEWDYDENFELFAHDRKTGKDTQLTFARGYDAEGSYSPDGQWICFASNRSAYLEPMSAADKKRFELDKALFMELYICRADGSEVKRLTYSRGYDGGPFFSADGKKICWRRFSEDGLTAEIYTMNVDGSDERRLTYINAMSWAPYFHPSGDYLIFTTNRHGFANFELYIVDAKGEREPVRVSNIDGFDGLPSFTRDGRTMAWTSNRSKKQSQIFTAKWDHAAALRALRASPRRQVATTTSRPSSQATSQPQSSTPRASTKTTAKITAGDLVKHVAKLTSKEFNGRLTGTPGEKLATAWAAKEFERIGALAAGDDGSYFQNFRARMLTMKNERKDIVGRNVIARLPGISGEPPLIIGAHIDHLGSEGGRYSNARGDEKYGVHLGADDNASGVAGVLEIAEYLKDQVDRGRVTLKRDVIFALWSGEEIGLFGSKHFVREMKKRLGSENLNGRVAAYLNMDMIGRLNKQLVVSGVGSSTAWPGIIERRNAPVGLPLAMVMDCNLPTDTSAFFLNGVPILNAFTGAHEDYHTPRDTANKLDFPQMARIVRLMSLVTRDLVMRENLIDFVEYEEKTPTMTGGARPYLGTIPDYAGGDIPGVLLDGVAKGGPAWKAGVRGGDTIVGIGGVAIADIYEYTAALEKLKVDVKTTISVIRKGQRKTFDLVPGSRE